MTDLHDMMMPFAHHDLVQPWFIPLIKNQNLWMIGTVFLVLSMLLSKWFAPAENLSPYRSASLARKLGVGAVAGVETRASWPLRMISLMIFSICLGCSMTYDMRFSEADLTSDTIMILTTMLVALFYPNMLSFRSSRPGGRFARAVILGWVSFFMVIAIPTTMVYRSIIIVNSEFVADSNLRMHGLVSMVKGQTAGVTEEINDIVWVADSEKAELRNKGLNAAGDLVRKAWNTSYPDQAIPAVIEGEWNIGIVQTSYPEAEDANGKLIMCHYRNSAFAYATYSIWGYPLDDAQINEWLNGYCPEKVDENAEMISSAEAAKMMVELFE